MRRFLIIVLALMLTGSELHAAGRVFTDGFEDGTTNKWATHGFHGRCTVVSSAFDGLAGVHSGTKMAQCNWNGVVAWNDSQESLVLVADWTYSSETLLRWWARYDADVDYKAGAKLYRIGASENSIGGAQNEQGTGATIYMNWYNAASQQLGPIFWGGGPALRDNQWHKYEMYFKNGTGNAIIRVWIDGTQIYNQTTATSDTGGWSPFHMMSNWTTNPGWEHDGNNHVYWDDFEIYSDTGSGATGLMSDGSITTGGGTSPTAPSSLTCDHCP